MFRPKPILLIVVLLNCNKVSANELERAHPLELATSCVRPAAGDFESQLPNCSFSSTTPIYQFKTDCLKPGVLRIQGEYSTIKIKCLANYAIDFFYFGIQPTEAINVTWSKHITAETAVNDPIFEMEVIVWSINALRDYYVSTAKKLVQEIPTSADYTRTGRYVIRGIWNKTLEKSYHIFFEEGAKNLPTLLRNSFTKITIDTNQVKIPCLTSHFNSNVSVFSIKKDPHSLISLGRSDNVNPYSIPYVEGQSNLFDYKCVLEHGGYKDELLLEFPKEESSKDLPYGMEDLGSISRGDVEISYRSRIDNNSVIHVQPRCRVIDLKEPNTMLTTVPAHNFAYLRLVREFAMPKYMNRSYTVKKGTEILTLQREIWIADENTLNGRFGVTFCMSGNEHKILEYGTSHTNGEVIKINYGLDWTLFDRHTSYIRIFYLLSIENYVNGVTTLFANTVMTFICRVHEAVVVKPTIWYTRRKNGDIVRELIDYNWNGPFSYLKKNMTSDITEVFCAGSFWYSSSWRNTSMRVNLIDGKAPLIKTTTSKYTFRPNLQHQILNCEVEGNPQPNASWSFNGFDISSNAVRTETAIILDFPEIKESHAGIYECSAVNQWGTAWKKFVVEVEEEPVPNYGLIIGIPLIIIVILAVLAVLYIRRWKKRQIGLTKAEIQEFMEGQITNVRSSALDDQYAHGFAHMAPYTGEHEISSSKFQIDETTLLGSGQYGVVYKGLLGGVPVAVKTTTKNADNKYLKALLSELKIMIHLGPHKNVVQFLGSNTAGLAKGAVYIFVKFYPLGSLEKFLKSSRHNYIHEVTKDSSYTNSFNYYKLISWSQQIASGMNYLGSRKVIHGDLATRNILLTEDMQAQITDFGLSRQLYNYSDYVKKNQEPLPWRWLAIESLRDLTFSTQSDVWSYGVTLWEIFSLGQVPYPGMSWTWTFVEELEKGLRMRKPIHASEILYELVISECWHNIPSERPTFKRILEILEESFVIKAAVLSPARNTYMNQPTHV